MIIRLLVVLAAVLGPAWAAEFDPASYRTLHYAGEIRHDGYVDLSRSIAYRGSINPVTEQSVPVARPPAAASGAHPDPQPAGDVTAPGAASTPTSPARNPHDGGKVRYYLNAIAADLESGQNPDTFAVGAIIVKEKWHASTDAQPTVITVMQKLSDANEVTSWSFRMYDCATHQDLTAAYLKQASTSCVECHARWAVTDFVSPDGFVLIKQPAP